MRVGGYMIVSKNPWFLPHSFRQTALDLQKNKHIFWDLFSSRLHLKSIWFKNLSGHLNISGARVVKSLINRAIKFHIYAHLPVLHLPHLFDRWCMVICLKLCTFSLLPTCHHYKWGLFGSIRACRAQGIESVCGGWVNYLCSTVRKMG